MYIKVDKVAKMKLSSDIAYLCLPILVSFYLVSYMSFFFC